MKLTPQQLEKLFKAADAARTRVSGYSDETRAMLEERGRNTIRGVSRGSRKAVCRS